jgi:hypothetical protein
MDHVTWHGKSEIFLILRKNLMYMGCNGAICVYTICITVAHMYVQNFEFLTFD